MAPRTNQRRTQVTPVTAVMIVAWIAVGLWADIAIEIGGQLAVTLATWGFFGVLFAAGSRERRERMAWCLALAWIGELFLVDVWGLYGYRLGNLPLFVPPGHVLLFLAGGSVADRVGRHIVLGTVLLGVSYCGWVLVTGRDQLSLLLFASFCASLANRDGRPLYATMFCLALLMELYGTHLGNWVWAPETRPFGWTAANPPMAAGAFYCILDLLVLQLTRSARE